LSRIGDQELLARQHGNHAGALAPSGHEPVQRVSIDRSMLDPAVSRPAGNACAVRLRPTNLASVVPTVRAFSTLPRPRTSSTIRLCSSSFGGIEATHAAPAAVLTFKGSVHFEFLPVMTKPLYGGFGWVG
jgi:hypothetical protein